MVKMQTWKSWLAILVVAGIGNIGSGCTTSTPAEPTVEAPSEEEAASQSVDPLERELARIEEKADEKLFSDASSCSEMTELEECRNFESKKLWIPAAGCFHDWIDLGLAAECRSWQVIKSAALFERAGEHKKAAQLRMDIFAPGGQHSLVLGVSVANWLVEHGQPERARIFYLTYLSEAPDGVLADYVRQRCAKLDGGCEL